VVLAVAHGKRKPYYWRERATDKWDKVKPATATSASVPQKNSSLTPSFPLRCIFQDGKAVSGMEATTLLAPAVMSSTIDDELIYQRSSPTHVD
jgi:hypothetical protein